MARWSGRIAALLTLVLAGIVLDGFVQARPAAEVDVGGRDLGYVEGFSAKEWSAALPGPAGPEAGTFRWMGPAGTLYLGPVQAGRPLRLRLCMGRPAGPPAQAQLYIGGHLQGTFQLGPVLQEYVQTLPPQALTGAHLVVRLEIEPFQVAGDPRDLGLVLERARLEVEPGGMPWNPPGALHPMYGLVAAALALTALALGLRFWPAWGLGALCLALAAGLAAWQADLVLRLGPTLAVLLALAAALAGGARVLGPLLSRLAAWLGDRAHWVLLGLFLLALLLCFFPHIEADGIEYYAYLRSLAFDGDLHFANELSPDTPFPHVPYGLGSKKTATGYEPNYASVGPAIVWTPFFAVGHVLALAGRALGMSWTLDGYSEPYIVLIGFASTLSGLVTLLLGYDLARRLCGPALGLLSTVATFVGTTLFYYVFYKPDFAHALATCAVTVLVYMWFRTREKRTWWQWLLLGLAAGFMTTLYWINAIFALLPALDLLEELLRALRGQVERDAAGKDGNGSSTAVPAVLLRGAVFAGAFVLAFAPQMVVWKIIFGQWLTVPQEGFATPGGFAVLELLLSPLHGLLPWTPIAVVGMGGLLLLAWKKRPWGLWALLALATFFLYNASLGSWHGGGTFGLRRLTNAYPFFLLGVATLLAWLRQWRKEAALLAAGLPAFWGAMTLLRYQAYTIPHYPSELEGLSLGEFLLAPGNMPVDRLPDVLGLSFFWQWIRRLAQGFQPVDLGYGLLLLLLFCGAALAVAATLRQWGVGNETRDTGEQDKATGKGDGGTRGQGDKETRRQGDREKHVHRAGVGGDTSMNLPSP